MTTRRSTTSVRAPERRPRARTATVALPEIPDVPELEELEAMVNDAPVAEPLPPTPAPAAPAQLATLERLGQTVVATITVTELSGSDAAILMTDLLNHVGASGVKHFVFDLQNVNYMDSSCIGAMVELLTRLERSGGRIALVNAGQSVEYLFRLTRLDRLFPICRDVMTAIAAIERAAEGRGRKGKRR